MLFKSPPAEYAPTSFWFWNGALEIPELLRQVEEQNAKGVRGFFMHARGGLISPAYLSKGWMDCVEAVVRRAAELGCQAWIYDELGWPSGTAGGRVPRKGPAYQQQFLECRIAGIPPRADLPVDPVPIATARLGRDTLTFHIGRQPHYIDTLNPLATRAFIRATHEQYLKRVGRNFGATIPGAFTDEPSHRAWNLRDHVLRVPWSKRLPSEFRRRRGYDLLPHLASLFFDVGDFARVRYDFHLTVSELFVEGYGKPLFDWCARHGIAFTGHYEYEVPLRMQVQCLTSAMPLYEYMQIPGLDLLAKNRPQFERIESIVLAKQPASVAHQLGRRRVLVEAFGTAGWDLGPQGLRWQADWLQALGANLICMHGFYYSLAGRRKLDAPPDLFFRQPWWPVSRTLHDHMARVSLLLSQGRPLRDVLVIHPIATAWITHRPQDHAGRRDYEPDPLGRAFARTLDALVRSHHDHDLGDERLLARHGRVRAGRLRVGRASYSSVVIPPGVRTLDTPTRRLLQRFASAGGTIIAFAPLPQLSAGRRPEAILNPDEGGMKGRDREAVASLAASAHAIPPGPLSTRLATLVRALDRARANRTRVTGANARDIALHERRLPSGDHVLFLANSGAKPADLRVSVSGRLSVEEWCTTDGSSLPIRYAHRPDATEWRVHIAPMGSRLFICHSEPSPDGGRGGDESRARKRLAPSPRERAIHEFASEWQVRADADNVLVFDMCRWRIGNGRWSELVPVFKAARLLAGRPSRHFGLRFEFCNRLSGEAAPVAFALENFDQFAVKLNGTPLSGSPRDGFFLDPACIRCGVSPYLRAGMNVLEIRGETPTALPQYGYLLGGFAVHQETTRRFALIDAPTVLDGGGWERSGYPFYPGPMTYRQRFAIRPPTGQKILLHVANLSQAASVLINGRPAGDLLWQPFELDVTSCLSEGKHELALRIYGSLRNTLGPWHLPGNRRIVGYSQQHFEDGAGWMDRYDFVPMGLLGRVRLVAR